MNNFESPVDVHFPGKTVAQIGNGGFAIVDRVEINGNACARKMLILDADILSDAEKLRERRHRFYREIDLLEALQHPNIPKVHDSFEYSFERGLPATPAYIMELARGSFEKEHDHSDWTAPDRRLTILSLLWQAAYTLAFIHKRNVIHRDLKPENFLITFDGRLLISDFGLSKNTDALEDQVTKFGAVGGTRGYQAPEQHSSLASATKASDIFSFGAILMRISTGQLPDPWAPEKTQKALSSLPSELRVFIERCIELNPLHRFNDGSEMAREYLAVLSAALGDWLPGEVIEVPHSFFEALTMLANLGDNSLVGQLPNAYEASSKTSVSTFIKLVTPRVIKTAAACTDAQSFVKLIYSFDRNSFQQTQAWSDVETVGRFYRKVLHSIPANHNDTLDFETIRDFQLKLTRSLLKKSVELHRFDGGREFLRCFTEKNKVSSSIFHQIIAENPDGHRFLRDEVHHEAIALPEDILQKLAQC